MMQEVVSQVVADVAKNTSTVNSRGGVPAVKEQNMRQLPKRRCEKDEQRGWHDESVLVHGQIVVNAMQQEVQGYEDSVVREIAVVGNMSAS